MPKLVYISHPISGDVENNIKDILKICKKVHTNRIIPFAPYLVAASYLKDHLTQERQLALKACLEAFKRRSMDEMWLSGVRISNGMKEEIKLAVKYRIPIKCYNKKLEKEFKRFLKEI